MEDERRADEEIADMQAEDSDMERLQEEIRNLPVADHVMYMMQSLSALAVGRMGLGGDEQPRKDLDQARLAIDAFKALLEVVEKAKPADAKPLRGMLAQLQLAYVAALDDRPPTGGMEQAAPTRDPGAESAGTDSDAGAEAGAAE
jgi:hypothetical protein